MAPCVYHRKYTSFVYSSQVNNKMSIRIKIRTVEMFRVERRNRMENINGLRLDAFPPGNLISHYLCFAKQQSK